MSHLVKEFPMMELGFSDMAGNLTKEVCGVVSMVEDVFTVISFGEIEASRADITC